MSSLSLFHPRSPTTEFREWRYMSQIYQQHMDELLSKATSKQSNQFLLEILQTLSAQFFSNPVNFNVEDIVVGPYAEFRAPFTRLFSCIQGKSEEDYLNPEIYRDTPDPERMAYKNYQRSELIDEAQSVFEKAQEILGIRNRWSEQEFICFHQQVMSEETRIAQSQLEAREESRRLSVAAAAKRAREHQQKQELLAMCELDGMNYHLVIGSPFDLDFDLAYEAVRQNGLAYQWISQILLNDDYELVLTKTALKSKAEVFQMVDESLQTNMRFCSLAFVLNFHVWKFLNLRLKHNHEFFQHVIQILQEDSLALVAILENDKFFEKLATLHRLVIWSEAFSSEADAIRVASMLNLIISLTEIEIFNEPAVRTDALLYVSDLFSKFLLIFESNPLSLKKLLKAAPIFIAEFSFLFELSIDEVIFLIKKQPKILKFFSLSNSNNDLILRGIDSLLKEYCTPFSETFDLKIGHEKLLELFKCMPSMIFRNRAFLFEALAYLDSAIFDIYYHAEISEEDFMNFSHKVFDLLRTIPSDLTEGFKEEEMFIKYSFLFYGVSQQMRADENFIKKVARDNPRIFLFAAQEVRENQRFILKLLKENIKVLRFVSEDIKRNKNFFLHAVAEDYTALKYASKQLRTDPEFVLDIVRVNPFAFKGADSSLRINKAYVNRVYNEDARALFGASYRLRKRFENGSFIETMTHETVTVTETVFDRS